MAAAMRAGIIEVARAKKLVDGSDEKTTAIYQYVISNEFRQAIQTFAETFASFQRLKTLLLLKSTQWHTRKTPISS